MQIRVWCCVLIAVCLALGKQSPVYAADIRENWGVAEWLEQARQAEARITGEEPESVPENRILVESLMENEMRLLSLAGKMKRGQELVCYVIGRNVTPVGTVLKALYAQEIRYANLTEARLEENGDCYTVSRFSLSFSGDSSCTHTWEERQLRAASCLQSGRLQRSCICGKSVEVILPALGHIDENRDSVCDRCRLRTFAQEEGSEITVTVSVDGGNTHILHAVCVDEDYRGGMLYVSKDEIALEEFGGYGELDYRQSNVYRYFADGWQNGWELSDASVMTVEAEGALASAMLLSLDEAVRFRDRIKGAYLTRTVEGNGLVLWKESGETESVEVEKEDQWGIRPAFLLKKPDPGVEEAAQWRIGDVMKRSIAGQTYLFRCIDENYVDPAQNHRQTALFLCDRVIPADFGSKHIWRPEKGEWEFVPGPLTVFGASGEYKYSAVRSWLAEESEDWTQIETIYTGERSAYMGSTNAGAFGQLRADGLRAFDCGDQQMTDRLFLLSVDEALRYREWLWRFDGSQEENPETQTESACKGYWLRSPVWGDDTMAYQVDLVQGQIRPESVKPLKSEENGEAIVPIGVRPAFAVAQMRGGGV